MSPPLLTRAERTAFLETSLHADVMAFIAALPDPRLHVTSFGVSPQGRELPLLILSTRGVRTPDDARRIGLPVVLIVDGIHPGEVEGKEASLALVRDLLATSEGDVLAHMTLLVVPLFNPDGNDALDPANRRLDLRKLTGQIGPVVGTRTQSHGINLNRDYLRQAAPEMRLLQSRVCQPWAPDLTIDNHATNGSLHRFHMTVDVPHTIETGRPEPIDFMRHKLIPDVMKAVRRRGFHSGWYGNFVEDERVMDVDGDVDPNSPVREGWMTYPHHPRFGSNYRGLTGRLDILLECYSYLPFEERVATARAWQSELLAWAATHGPEIQQVVAEAERPRDNLAIRYKLATFAEPVEILTRTPRTLEGAETAVTIPHLARFIGAKVVTRPNAYAVPPSLAALLQRHGLVTTQGTSQSIDCQVARVESVGTEGGRGILEAGAFGDVQVSWREERRTLPEGWSLVPTDQRLAGIAAYLCEPESDDGAIENGGLGAVSVGEEFPAWRVE